MKNSNWGIKHLKRKIRKAVERTGRRNQGALRGRTSRKNGERGGESLNPGRTTRSRFPISNCAGRPRAGRKTVGLSGRTGGLLLSRPLGGFYRALTPTETLRSTRSKIPGGRRPVSGTSKSFLFVPAGGSRPHAQATPTPSPFRLNGAGGKKKTKPGSGPSFLEQPTPKELPPPQRVRLVGILGFETHLRS